METNSFKTLNEFVKAWIKGEYPKLANNEQVEKILTRLREGNIRDPTNGEFNSTFYRSVSRDDMLQDLSEKICVQKSMLGIWLVTLIGIAKFSLQIQNLYEVSPDINVLGYATPCEGLENIMIGNLTMPN